MGFASRQTDPIQHKAGLVTSLIKMFIFTFVLEPFTFVQVDIPALHVAAVRRITGVINTLLTIETREVGNVHTLACELTLTGFLLSRVGNTGIPGVWLFHTGNRYSFDNIVPASVGGLLATPPTRGHGLSLVILF